MPAETAFITVSGEVQRYFLISYAFELVCEVFFLRPWDVLKKDSISVPTVYAILEILTFALWVNLRANVVVNFAAGGEEDEFPLRWFTCGPDQTRSREQ